MLSSFIPRIIRSPTALWKDIFWNCGLGQVRVEEHGKKYSHRISKLGESLRETLLKLGKSDH